MGEGYSRSEWSRMSSLLALTANMNRDPKKGKALSPKDFDPHEIAEKHETGIRIESMAQIKGQFVKE